MPFGTEVGLGLDDIVSDGDPTPRSTKGTFPQFLAHVYCGQSAVCIMKALGTEVGLNLFDIVLDGDRTPPPLKGHCPQFRPMSVVAKWLDGLRWHFVWR